MKEIRNQPEYIREIFMWVSVVIVSSLVLFGWLKSTQNKIYALINPDAVAQERALAEANKANQPSLFANITGSLGGIKNSLNEFFGGEKFNSASDNQPEVEANKLPVTD